MRVLVAEDDVLNHLGIKSQLAKWGIKSLIVRSKQELLSQAKSENYDVLLTNLHLSDGQLHNEELNDLEQGIPKVVMMSASRRTKHPTINFLEKPYSLRSLNEAIFG